MNNLTPKKRKTVRTELLNEVIEAIDYTEGVTSFREEDFNTFFVVGLIMGPHSPIIRVGRLVQVRYEAGAFGSNLIFLRQCDGKLQVHENQVFYRVQDKFIKRLEKLFKKIPLDTHEKPYTIKGKFPESGFIIPSKIKPGESTPMRDVTNAIRVKLAEFFERDQA